MNCEQIQKTLHSDFINKIHRHVTDSLHVHLLGCPACRKHQEAIQQMYAVFQDEDQVILPQSTLEEMNAVLEDFFAPKRKRRKRFLFWYALGLTGLLVLGGFGFKQWMPAPMQEQIKNVGQSALKRMDALAHQIQNKVETVADKVADQTHKQWAKLTHKENPGDKKNLSENSDEGNFDKISKKLSQSVKVQINTKDLQHTVPKTDVEKELLDLGVAEELDQETAKQQNKDSFDQEEHTDEISSVDQTAKEENDDAKVEEKQGVEKSIDEVTVSEDDDEDDDDQVDQLTDLDSLDKDGHDEVDEDDDVEITDLKQITPPDSETHSCRLQSPLHDYEAEFADEDLMLLQQNRIANNFDELSAQGLYPHRGAVQRLNWRDNQRRSLGDIVLGFFGLNRGMTADLSLQGLPTVNSQKLDEGQQTGSANEMNGKLTLNKSEDAEAQKLEQILQELDEGSLSQNQLVNAGQQNVGDQSLSDVSQNEAPYRLEYCEEDPRILKNRQYSLFD